MFQDKSDCIVHTLPIKSPKSFAREIFSMPLVAFSYFPLMRCASGIDRSSAAGRYLSCSISFLDAMEELTTPSAAHASVACVSMDVVVESTEASILAM